MVRRRPVFKEDAWRSLDTREKGLILGVLVGAVLALITWQLTWIAVGTLTGLGIGHIAGRRRMQDEVDPQAHTINPEPYPEAPKHPVEQLRGSVDEELSAALKARREAWLQYKNDPARKAGKQVPNGDERFLAEFGAELGHRAIAVSRALNDEADSIRDPGGPLLGEYAQALYAWAESHPEINRAELDVIVNRLLWEHR